MLRSQCLPIGPWLPALLCLVLAACSDAASPAAEPDVAVGDATGPDSQVADAAKADAGGKPGANKDIFAVDGNQFPDLPVNSSPTVAWVAPSDGQVVPAQVPFAVTATVADGQTAPAELGFDLHISNPPAQAVLVSAVVGNTVTLQVPGLSPGPHTLTLTVTDGMGGAAVVARTVVATVQPQAPVVKIEPESPTTQSNLSALVTPPATGPGSWSGSTELQFQWYQDNLPPPWATYASVPASQTARGEVWRVQVRALVDGQWSAVAQAQVVIGNAAPGPVGLAFAATPPDVGGVALCAVETPSTDPDGDTVDYTYAWTLAGQPVAGATEAVLALASHKEGPYVALLPAKVGDELVCIVTAHDGQGGESATKLAATLGANPACSGSGNPCDLAALCSPTDSAAVTCTCKPGYQGDGTTCTDSDECSDGSAGCASGALCQNVPGGALCSCPSGFAGDGHTCTDIDECAEATAACALSADCSNTAGSYTCTCHAGFAGNGYACSNIDECAGGSAACDPAATCTDTNGSYLCECAPGFQGDGLTCADVDECADVALSGCATEATCTNLTGGFACTCPTGYLGDGSTCVDLDECSQAPSPCADGATCSNLPGSYLCACSAGYLGDGLTCLNIDECADGSAGCSPLADCSDTDGSFTCTCKPGYTGNGKTCTPK